MVKFFIFSKELPLMKVSNFLSWSSKKLPYICILWVCGQYSSEKGLQHQALFRRLLPLTTYKNYFCHITIFDKVLGNLSKNRSCAYYTFIPMMYSYVYLELNLSTPVFSAQDLQRYLGNKELPSTHLRQCPGPKNWLKSLRRALTNKI